MSQSVSVIFIVITILVTILQKCGTYSYPSEPIASAAYVDQHGTQDEADDDHEQEYSPVILSNERYHRSTPSSSWNSDYTPFFGQSTIGGNDNFVFTPRDSVIRNAGSVAAIQFPGMSSTTTNHSSNYVHGTHSGIHGGNNMPFSNGAGRRASKIPLRLLRQIEDEKDITKVFAKYVSNVEVKDVGGHKQILSLQGNPLNIGLDPEVNAIQTQTTGSTKSKIATSFSNRKTNPIAIQENITPEQISIQEQDNELFKDGGCATEFQSVELPASNDPSIYQLPRCIRLKRCGGCCASELLTCENQSQQNVSIQVQKLRYNDETEKLDYVGSEVINMTSHTSCRCNCKVKASDCSPRHEYISQDCACHCKNTREYEYCNRQPQKLWDPNLCQCVCRHIVPCSSGYSFSLDNCQCARIPETGPNVSRKRRRSETVRFIN